VERYFILFGRGIILQYSSSLCDYTWGKGFHIVCKRDYSSLVPSAKIPEGKDIILFGRGTIFH
jgi:hypothetical protein